MKISMARKMRGFRRTAWFLAMPVLAGGILAAIGVQPALAQRDEHRFDNDQRAEEHHDNRRPPKPTRQQARSYYGYYDAPRVIYAPPPVVYAPPSALEFVFPLSFR